MTRSKVSTRDWLDGQVRDDYSYVYYDYIVKTGKVFYIGSGNKTRVLIKKRCHNKGWNYITSKHTWKRVIMYESLDREEVYQAEELLISLHWGLGIINSCIYAQRQDGSGLSDFRDQYKVICINTGVEYMSAEHAAKAYDLSVTTIRSYCRGGQYYAGDIDDVPLRWRYADSVDKMAHITDEFMLQCRNQKAKKPITCDNNGLSFDSIYQACKKYNLLTSNLSSALSGKIRYCGTDDNGKPMRWRNEFGICYADGYTDEELLSINQKKAVIWINTGQVFECIKKAEQVTGINGVSSCCRGVTNYAGIINGIPQRWRFADGVEHSYGKTDKELLTKSNYKQVVCITTDEVFDTIGEAARCYNVDSSSLAKHCKGTNKTKCCGKHPETGEKLVWKYKQD